MIVQCENHSCINKIEVPVDLEAEPTEENMLKIVNMLKNVGWHVVMYDFDKMMFIYCPGHLKEENKDVRENSDN